MCMELGNSWLPDLNRPGMRDEDKMRAINEYLIDFEKKVRHALSNIDEDNLSEAMINTLNGTQTKIRELEENRGGGNQNGGNVATVDGVEPDQNGNVALGAVRKVNGETPDAAGNVTVEAEPGQPGPKGDPGKDGADGTDGATFTPSVSTDGVISWTNNGGLANPEARSIAGPRGPKGDAGNVATWLDIVLTAAGWTGLSQTVDAVGVTADNDECTVVVSPAPGNCGEYAKSGIVCTAQGAGTLTFKAESTPSSNVTVNVMIVK